MNRLVRILAECLITASISWVALICAAQAQTAPPKMVYTCPTETAVTKQAATTADCPAWSWQPPPAANAEKPLIAFCTDCTWSRNTGQIKWKRPKDTAAAELVAICTRNPALAAGSKADCSPESFVRSDSVLTTSTTPPTVPNPTVAITALPASLPLGDLVTLTWSSTNSTSSCDVSGEWGGTAPSNGSQVATPQAIGTKVYTIRCVNTAGVSAVASASVVVAPKPPGPVARILSLVIAPKEVPTREPVTITWTSENATSCSSSWAASVDPQGSKTLSHDFPLDARVWVKCGNSEWTDGYRVVSRGPACRPRQDHPEDQNKVAIAMLSFANWTAEYQGMAAWYCPTPQGPKLQLWLFNAPEAAIGLRQYLNRQLDDAAVSERCELLCKPLPAGPQREELEMWGSMFRPDGPEGLGVIGE